MADDDIRATTADPRGPFLTVALPLLLGDCHLVKDHDSWCAVHDSLWMTGDYCAKVGDYATFADSLIEMWDEGRHGR